MIYLLVFIILPFAELMVFIEVADEIGFFNAIFLIFINAIIGAVIIRNQGFRAVFSIGALRAGDRREEIFDDVCLTVAGLLLILPGFVTDGVGFLLLVPAVRKIVRKIIGAYAEMPVETSGSDSTQYSSSDILEGEYTRMNDD